MTMTTSTPGVLFPKPATIKMGLDMDGTLKFGTSTHIVMDMPQYNTTTETKSSAIFDATTKRYTMYSEIITKSSSALPNPNPPATCKYIEIATLPAPVDFAKCINDITENSSSDTEINFLNDPTMRTHTEVIDMNAKAGAPDASFFMVPKEWGECTEETMPPL
eukprot:CAMPEP_0169410550 /NCGR_PEP_ID=MMETSP1017-20121227/59835_1 /TAXON_ID=342587 /ORGANISM="Karlodinium micrum, Strain CCMP2283" /LENGTH=162 /DNA_ID=CAMNT_0009517811 /DNA_START=94 /DNA_END=578 /DNA_ORIENTATION=+